MINQDLSERMDTSDEWMLVGQNSEASYYSIRINRRLATEVARRLLEKSGLQADQLDFIIVAAFRPIPWCHPLQLVFKLKLGPLKAFVLIWQQRSGFVFALATAESCFSLASTNEESLLGDWLGRSRTTAVLLGMVLAVFLWKLQATFLAERFIFWYGSRGEVLQSSSVGLSSPYSDKEEDKKIFINGRAVFDFAIQGCS